MRRKKLLTIFTVFLSVSIISGCGTASSKEEAQSAVPGNEEKNGSETLDLFIDLTWYYSDNWDGIIPEEIGVRQLNKEYNANLQEIKKKFGI